MSCQFVNRTAGCDFYNLEAEGGYGTEKEVGSGSCFLQRYKITRLSKPSAALQVVYKRYM